MFFRDSREGITAASALLYTARWQLFAVVPLCGCYRSICITVYCKMSAVCCCSTMRLLLLLAVTKTDKQMVTTNGFKMYYASAGTGVLICA
jgi:hypothetical protein